MGTLWCNCLDCIFNEGDTCDRAETTIDAKGNCQDYKSKNN